MITGKILKTQGWEQGKAMGLAKRAAQRLEQEGMEREAILARLDQVRAAPDSYLADPILGDLASELSRHARRAAEAREAPALRGAPLPYGVWGAEQIDAAARAQMDQAMRLPVSVAGALMPDAHVGYGLPIGGVLATAESVIPYAVGVDIACFTGDTRVVLADGQNGSLAELAESGAEVVVFSCTPSGRVVASRARAMKTRSKAELVMVTLDNGAQIRCTPDHEFALRDGRYARACDLPPGASLMPLYQERDRLGLHNHRRLVHGYNHKVVSVEPLGQREDVYCLTVPGYENFALEAGVFVHNCRMRLSVYPTSPDLLDQEPARFQRALLQNTYFGSGVTNPTRPEHPILDDEAWKATRLLRPLRDVAARQLGTSGTGNHFVEWGSLTLLEPDPRLGLPAGTYLALLSHSGSRGVGFKIANTYSTLATQLHPRLEKSVQHLAWLSLDSEPGQEYWEAMELAGRFASANHQVIHRAVAHAAGLSEVAVVENFHNWAAREVVTGADGSEQEVIVHRKGATPAAQGVLGVIPGSMADAGYVVRGRGEPAALRSAAHGAGRAMSRKAALNTISKQERDRYLDQHHITLLGGGLDESPQAYKRIEDVIAAQQDLVELIGRFRPRIVRMASEPGDI